VADGAQEISSSTLPPAESGVEECWTEIDGARMRYLRAGSGPPLILLHGLMGYAFSWRYTMPALAPYATIYAPDMLGAGFSDRPAGLDHSMRATARRMVRFILHVILHFSEQPGISSFDLLGTSHGGAVAIMAAEQCLAEPRLRLRKLVLVAPVNPYSAHGRYLGPFLGSAAGSALFRMTIARMTFLFRYGHRRLYGSRGNIPPGALQGYMAPLAIPGLFEHALSIFRTWTCDLRQLEAALPKLREIPTLLLWGDLDRAVYASSAAPLAKHFADSQTIVFPGIGHLPYEECPEEFNRALIQFLTREKLPG